MSYFKKRSALVSSRSRPKIKWFDNLVNREGLVS
jgi:hypothetical protein